MMRHLELGFDVFVQGVLLAVFGLVILTMLQFPGLFAKFHQSWLLMPRRDTKAEREASESLSRYMGILFALFWMVLLISFLRDLVELVTRLFQ